MEVYTMYDGIRKATIGMEAMNQKQDVLLNNLANVGTTGYRRENMIFSSFSEVMEKEMTFNPSPTKQSGEYQQGSIDVETDGRLYKKTSTSFAQGSLKNTGSQFDLALDDNGKGFFTIKTDKGLVFTRGGSFRLDNSGYLVTQDGSFVMGHKGKIKIGGTNFEVTNDAKIKVDGKEVDKLLITEFDPRLGNKGLTHQGDNNFSAMGGGRISTDSAVKQGFLEMANVNAVQSMIDLMTTMRAYEANQKTLQSEDKMIQKTVNETGKLR
jgi:flagellar basal-body rod protein FlgF